MDQIRSRAVCLLLAVTLLTGPAATDFHCPTARAADPTEPGFVHLSDLTPAPDSSQSSPAKEFVAQPVSFQEQRARTPSTTILPGGSQADRPTTARTLAGSAVGLSLLSERRRRSRGRARASIVSGNEAGFRASTDAGSLLGKTHSIRGLTAQRRNPINTDTRIRGSRAGQLAASGSYWVPARIDLDTMLSKLDSGTVDDIAVINGPYSALHGPGFGFVDVNLRPSPRSGNGPQQGGRTSLEYKTNGEQWYGRQTAWIAAEDYGLRVSYGHRTGSDYFVGGNRNLSIEDSIGAFDTFKEDTPGEMTFQGADSSLISPIKDGTLPSSYKSRDLALSYGFDPTDDSQIEFSYLRLDQTDVEFPGLVFDLNYLVTNAWELTYELDGPASFDGFTFNTWHNQTRFAGDTFRSGKNLQIPSLVFKTAPKFGLGNAATRVNQSSSGFQTFVTWDDNGTEFTAGIDLRYLTQDLNDIDDPNGNPENFPIPNAWSVNPGLFIQASHETETGITIHTGGRVDYFGSSASNTFPFQGRTTTERLKAPLNQEMYLGSGFVTADYELNDHITLNVGAAYAQRPPNLTELYAALPFIGSLQPGLTYVIGDPTLNPETLKQIDVGVDGDFGAVRGSVSGFIAWIDDYITYHGYMTSSQPTALREHLDGHNLHEARYVNTKLATLAGFELAAETDFNDLATGFATMNFVEGRDRSRIRGIRAGSSPRSGIDGIEHEPLPGIAPLETRLGVRITDGSEDPDRLIELSVRIVDNQDRIARSLLERETPGFSIWDLRTYWRPAPDWVINAGVENFTNKFYREHLDFRTGFGVYQPGVNFYLSTEVTY